jgi:ubiquinone/menaquinone biosynthesis C-methylase UbiE
MHERRFSGDIERLRSPERVARLEVEHVVQLSLQGIPVQQVLDVGAGTGLFSEAFLRAGCQVTGIDVNPEMLAAARRLVPGADFQDGVAEALPVSDQSQDLVFFGLLLHETDDLLQALLEARRVARLRVTALEWPYKTEEHGPPLEHRLKPEHLRNLALQAGFKQIERTPLEHLHFYRMEK